MSLFQQEVDQSGLEDEGVAGVGHRHVPAALRYVWQKLSCQGEDSLFTCLCVSVSCTHILSDLCLFATAVYIIIKLLNDTRSEGKHPLFDALKKKDFKEEADQ